MTNRVLVTYATRRGSTLEIAQFIGQTLREDGFTVDVRNVAQSPNIADYDAVVVGSAIRMGNWLAEVQKFLKSHQEELCQKPLAYFTVCLTLAEDTPEHRQEVSAYLTPVRAIVPAKIEGFFAGEVNVQELPFLFRVMFQKVNNLPDGDFRDWDAIKQWAHDLKPILLGQKTP